MTNISWLRLFLIAGFLFFFVFQACGNYPVDKAGVDGTEETVTRAAPAATAWAENYFVIFPAVSGDYLVNPGIGWQAGPGDSDQIYIPETVAYSNRREIAWSVLNPSEDVYDWTVLDRQLSKAVEAGKQFSFRVYSMVGEPFGSHMVPSWVLEKGAVILPTSEPHYSNCVYQEEWGKFVDQLRSRYDGSPDIAFIDISGYGNFNEWSWQSSQTEWDSVWEENYSNGSGLPQDFQTLDGQARRRLADIFIGGSFQAHECRAPGGGIELITYSYPGFQKTQLVMPYAGIVQSTQYVASRRNDVGFRFDCLGNSSMDVFGKVGREILQLWRNAPVVYELCPPKKVEIESAQGLLRNTHGSLIHNNASEETLTALMQLTRDAGYRYYLKEATVQLTESRLHLQMKWQNIGLAPNYPKMGQEFHLFVYLVDESGADVLSVPVVADISSWLPDETFSSAAGSNQYLVEQIIDLPTNIKSGEYQLQTGIINTRTGEAVLLAMEDTNLNDRFTLGSLKMK